ncbi:MAG: galactokinase [Ekhidna sp.]|nr:galactokinase [Ekhidna sp.]
MLKNRDKINIYEIEDHFINKYNYKPEVIVQSPGRINIMGEHTDYNEGYVLPTAIDHYMFIAVSKNQCDVVNIYSIDYDESYSLNLKEAVKRGDVSWANLIIGVVKSLLSKIGGIDLAFGGNIPEGAGVSSSAALCCGIAYALSELFNLKLEKWEMVKIAQKSEHEFALVQCGIMDQFACLFGITNHVLLLDCKTLTFQASEIDITGYKFILVNSNVKHNLKDSEYNSRKSESAKALEILKQSNLKVKSYQDVSLSMLDNMRSEMPDMVWKRAYHIVSDNKRVHQITDELKSRNYEKAGELLNEGHFSEKNFYEITCEETDFIVNELNRSKTVLGARQVGGGFGGCVLALVKDVNVNEVIDKAAINYKKVFSLTLDHIPVNISQGCHRIF